MRSTVVIYLSSLTLRCCSYYSEIVVMLCNVRRSPDLSWIDTLMAHSMITHQTISLAISTVTF